MTRKNLLLLKPQTRFWKLSVQLSSDRIISRKCARQNGLKRYYTGKPCRYGHIAERYCASGRCSECDSILQKSKEYREGRRAYEQLPHMREKRSAYNKTESRKASLSEMQRRGYRKNKPAYLMRLLVSRMPASVRDGMASQRTEQKLGYSLAEFKAHIESKFLEGMTWSNHGEWHIDHIIPVSKFDKSNIARVNDLSNLQPLWAFDNLSKGAKLEAGFN